MPNNSASARLTPEDIVIAAASQIDAHVVDTGLRDVLREVLVGFGTVVFSCRPARLPFAARLPAVVHAGVMGCEKPAAPLCGAAVLLFLGLDLLDDLMDGDTTPYWQGANPAETLLVATTLMSALPQAALGALNAPAATVAEMQRALASGLLAMAAGQRQDILAIGRTDATPEQVLESVAGKSGAFTGMLARLGALLAGASDDVVEAYHDWGFHFGIADQIGSDCADLFREPAGNDFRGHVITYPLACLLEATAQPERRRLKRTIDQAAEDHFDRIAIRADLKQKGVLGIVDHTIRWHWHQALEALERAAPFEPAGEVLRTLVAPQAVVAANRRD